MEQAKVYYTDFRTKAFGDGLPAKLQKLMRKAGIEDIDMDGKFVAIKLHFGELGNISYLRPNYARAVVDLVKSLGGKPFLTDCNTMYPGSRKNALEHLECAWQNGFTPLTVGCPILIGDGLKGTGVAIFDINLPGMDGFEVCRTVRATNKSIGIIMLTAPNLTAWLLRLPPILYMIYRISVLICSKAPWGLSV